MNNYGFLGIVQRGRFKPLATERDTAGSLRLTSVTIQDEQPPADGEMSLAVYESSAIMVRGIDKGEWIHSAIVIEQAGPILTAVVRSMFDSSDGTTSQHRLRPLLE